MPICRRTSSCREAAEVPQAFDANRDAMRKLYRYVIHDGPVPSPFLRRYCLPRPPPARRGRDARGPAAA